MLFSSSKLPGTITCFDLLNENLARLETSVIDLNARYILTTDFGDVNSTGSANWLDEYVGTTDAGAVSDRTDMVAGNVPDWAGCPEWRSTPHRCMTTWGDSTSLG